MTQWCIIIRKGGDNKLKDPKELFNLVKSYKDAGLTYAQARLLNADIAGITGSTFSKYAAFNSYEEKQEKAREYQQSWKTNKVSGRKPIDKEYFENIKKLISLEISFGQSVKLGLFDRSNAIFSLIKSSPSFEIYQQKVSAQLEKFKISKANKEKIEPIKQQPQLPQQSQSQSQPQLPQQSQSQPQQATVPDRLEERIVTIERLLVNMNNNIQIKLNGISTTLGSIERWSESSDKKEDQKRKSFWK